ncbi:hypothetical protein SAMN05216267_10543 [Actinacidiphila rubida]|uniref:Transposase n=1 Tax=Actinacidiphila rubida TaxID=310780 RepID=A0A1H8TJ72_9ACTN|nr:helix-turn-helix domain-containing protein [Actinacidiphila rubida]SEO90594.1 hypothetical protein SAMN05216267_10543 [Actinacidiphila rubida]
MRYAQGGGLTDERRAFREKLRMGAAERSARGEESAAVARDLRVNVRLVQRWRNAWSQGGPRALASKGPASLPLLSDDLFAVLEQELAKGPVAHGWPDRTWTLSRIRTRLTAGGSTAHPSISSPSVGVPIAGPGRRSSTTSMSYWYQSSPPSASERPR